MFLDGLHDGVVEAGLFLRGGLLMVWHGGKISTPVSRIQAAEQNGRCFFFELVSAGGGMERRVTIPSGYESPWVSKSRID